MRTPYVVFLSALVWVCSAYANDLLSHVPAPYDVPPHGWETHITPGFEPPIEGAIAFPPESWRGSTAGPRIRDKMDLWGPAAMPVLERMFDDPFWRDYRLQILSLIHRGPESRRLTFYHKAIPELSRRKLTDYEQQMLASLLAGLGEIAPVELSRTIDDLAADPAYAENSLRFLWKSLSLGPNAHYLDVFRTITANTSDPGQRELLEKCVSWANAIQRGFEPMEGQLARESGEQPKFNLPKGHGDKDGAAEAQYTLMKYLREHPKQQTYWLSHIQEVIESIGATLGDDAVPSFAQWACDQSMPRNVRVSACMGLGYIGSEKSVQAFKRLRDEAFGKPWAPAQQSRYTHSERMREALNVTLCVIVRDEALPGTRAQFANKGEARVEPDFISGWYETGGRTFRFRRFGDEWLPTGVESEWVY